MLNYYRNLEKLLVFLKVFTFSLFIIIYIIELFLSFYPAYLLIADNKRKLNFLLDSVFFQYFIFFTNNDTKKIIPNIRFF